MTAKRNLVIVLIGAFGAFSCGYVVPKLFGPRAEAKPLPIKGQPVTAKQADDIKWRDARDRALDSCYRSGGIPALGFGFTVVCIEGCVREFNPEKPDERRLAQGWSVERCQ